MTEQMLLRFAMILQSQAPSTLNKYICKLVEAVLLEHPTGLNLYALSQAINIHFNLAFTEEEIEAAITKKGQNRLLIANGIYSLSPYAIQSLSTQPSLSGKLDAIISKFVIAASIDTPVTDVSSLLLKYLYYCFNSNVDNLLSLFEEEITYSVKSFEASAKEISIINTFIAWEDSEKDSIVYSLIATCYEYCMLTIKKDNILSAELFKGKRFYLDANIIFRMAGVNNEERKTVTTGFVHHCQKAGIELYCTSATLDEVYRVITAQVEFIRGIAGSSMPVSSNMLESINPSMEINDFYKIYYEWCRTPGNRYGDYVSFNRYLLDLVQDTLRQLKIKESSAYKVGSLSKPFAEHTTSLKEYKNNKRKWRYTSTASAETDITNILDTLAWRKGTGTNIWQTNDFIVSADQLLIGWTDNAFPGVPIVVLPSVWLSIILRFTGRTDDDYKSFCLFLTQRQHIGDNKSIDPFQLLRNINSKTNQTEIKERIIVEITQNKAQYSFETTNDYDVNTNRAFDKVLEEVYGKTEQQINEIRNEMRQQVLTITNDSHEQIEECARRSAETEREKTLVTLSKQQAASKVNKFRNLSNHGWILYLLAGVVLIAGIYICAFEVSPIYAWLLSILPAKLHSVEAFMAFWTFASLGIALIFAAFNKVIEFLGSEKREADLYDRFYEKNKTMINYE